MKTKIFVIAAILFTLLVSASVLSQDFRGRDGDKDKFFNKEQKLEMLNLSEEQTDKIESLKLNHKKEMIDLVAEVEKKEVELEQLRNTLNFSRDEFLKKINEIISAKNKVALAAANHEMDIHQLLDDNQKKEWNQMAEMRHKRKHLVIRKMRERDIN